MAEDTITLQYDPFSLPTAQHRAGLAGLLVLIESLRKRSLGPLPEIQHDSDGRYQVAMSKACLTAIFNDLYDAAQEETEWKKQKKNKNKQIISPKREEKRKDENGKEITIYIYDQVVPKAGFFKALGMPEPWIKLWRDAVWSTLRDRDKKRIPYQERSRGKEISEKEKTWKSLCLFEKSHSHIDEIASSLFIGAQAHNAEYVPFRGRVNENLLLHFWPVVIGVYVPEIIDQKGNRDFAGYVLAIPDIVDMEGFVKDFSSAVAQLKPEMYRYRPRYSVISVPQEGALEYAHQVMALVKARIAKQEIAYNISSVEVYHLEKRGNNLYMLAADRVGVNHELLEDYENIRDRYLHPLFRRQIILNLLRGRPWYRDFDRLFSKNDNEFFLGSKDLSFQKDVRRRFKADFDEGRDKE